MKNRIYLICLSLVLGSFSVISAQESSKDLPIYDQTDLHLKNVDTIPGYASKTNKLKVSGTIYMSDGVTPAKDVILYIQQPDENGDFELIEDNDNRYVNHRGWIKTNADGQYTFYTFVPGGDRRYNQLQQLYPIVKEPSKEAYEVETFLFDEDPLLTKTCRKRMEKKGDPTRILKLDLQEGVYIAKRDIVLKSDV
ncbi:hypothetical protein HNV08_08175 [Winogradskyella eckloniae]|uniref:hypothetical protein n=1 Tax=Winogradskyella eckloniae TaxID=1089306 RepID=UPI001564B4EB|nr:hypothetical protein [Winogradskyella eckloniae]NRD20022.1 hypothetical protein [Winogradskyella eckloniae]